LIVAISDLKVTVSHINETRLFLSIIKRPLSFLFESNVEESLYVSLSAVTTE
jgi:hypothetical protein